MQERKLESKLVVMFGTCEQAIKHRFKVDQPVICACATLIVLYTLHFTNCGIQHVNPISKSNCHTLCCSYLRAAEFSAQNRTATSECFPTLGTWWQCERIDTSSYR